MPLHTVILNHLFIKFNKKASSIVTVEVLGYASCGCTLITAGLMLRLFELSFGNL